MQKQVLLDPMVEPKDSVLEDALGKKYELFTEFSKEIERKELILEWNYYKDTKSWLCKVLNKKKNLCWLSVWDTGFKLTFYFTEKNVEGIYSLDINNDIKEAIIETKHVGKLIPVIIEVKDKGKIKDGLKIMEYKNNLK